MTCTEHESRLDVMSRRGADPRAVDGAASEGLGITKDPAEYFPPIGNAASPLGENSTILVKTTVSCHT